MPVLLKEDAGVDVWNTESSAVYQRTFPGCTVIAHSEARGDWRAADGERTDLHARDPCTPRGIHTK